MPPAVSSMERDRRILPRAQVNLSSDPVQVGLPIDPESASPSLRIIRDQDLVTKIEVACSCGCKMRILCNYDPPTANG